MIDEAGSVIVWERSIAVGDAVFRQRVFVPDHDGRFGWLVEKAVGEGKAAKREVVARGLAATRLEAKSETAKAFGEDIAASRRAAPRL